MKRLVFAVALLALSIFGIASTAHAQIAIQAPMTDAHIERIRANCTSATQALRKIHVNDALSRVDRRQQYELISSRLMARFNSRVALNKLDGTSLLLTTSKYNESFNAFRASDLIYDNQVSDALKIDCHKQPVAFYDSVTKARELRKEVYRHNLDIIQYAKEYKGVFDEFRQQQISKEKVVQ
ncbi:MAG: hypothetical protein EOO17_02050 [Chloroflexi bacterium]|nr:MAG: hypothetical protein EOO17_02050 [Chloroflexota bacterium]